LKCKAADASIAIIDHNSSRQLQAGSSGEAHDFIVDEDVAAGADCGSVQVPFCAHVAVAFPLHEEIMKPPDACGEKSIRAEVVAVVDVQKENAGS